MAEIDTDYLFLIAILAFELALALHHDLAVAAYHAPDHLWRIPALLDALCPGYRIYLGHHPAAAYECELFCVHESRCGV